MAAGAECALKAFDGVRRPDVHRQIESLGGGGGRQSREAELEPPIAPVNFDRGGAGQSRDVEAWILARGNSGLGCAAGVGGVRRVAALRDENAIDRDQKFRRVLVNGGG